MLRLGALLLAVIQVASAVSIRTTQSTNLRQLSDIEKVQSDAAAVLSSLLKRLQDEQTQRAHFSDTFSQWCGAVGSQKVGMIDAIKRRLDEAAIEVRQISSDSKRLNSELSLVRSTSEEKSQQLADATDTERFAAVEFASEQRQVEKTLEAAHHAVRLLTTSSRPHTHHDARVGAEAVEATSNLMQLGSEGMTDAEKQIMSQYVEPKPEQPASSVSTQPQELLQTLQTLSSRLQAERDAGHQKQQEMAQKLWSFSDHLNLSIAETQSQAAAIRMELAQRKRERERIGGKTSDLAGLLKAVQASKATAETACMQQRSQDAQTEKYVTAEIDSVRTALEQMSPDGSDVFLEMPQPFAPSFLQTRQKQSQAPAIDQTNSPARFVLRDFSELARQFPEESPWYIDKEQDIALHVPAAAATPSAVHQPTGAATMVSTGQPTDNALRDIQQFVATESSADGDTAQLADQARPLLSDPDEAEQIKGAYEGLLAKVQRKEQSLDNRTKWCHSIVRDARVDGQAMGRSVKRMSAKLNLVKVAMVEYEKGSKYNAEQSKAIKLFSEQLVDITDNEVRHINNLYSELSGFTKQLRTLAQDLGKQLTEEERRGAELAKALLQKVLTHQNLLESTRQLSTKRQEAIERADAQVQEALRTDVQHNNRRLVRLKAELSFLTSLSHAKANDQGLSDRFRTISGNLCSAERMSRMQSQDGALRKQAVALQRSFSTNVAPFAS